MLHHILSVEEVVEFRKAILSWYNKHKRSLPWRDLTDNLQDRAYKTLVSEIMLQQTQVKTVVNYYQRWIDTWPTLKCLSKASLEEVNVVWAGLGYYARGQRLLQLAQKSDGVLPDNSVELLSLPGVGRYTAGAVASIVFGERVSAVDGNVIRVITRLTALGGNVASNSVQKKILDIAEQLVDPGCPGDFNQAMIELGATVCTPRLPQCDTCPVNEFCRGRMLTRNDRVCDIEECHLCLPNDSYNPLLGVLNFPQKAKKKEPRKEKTIVCVIGRSEPRKEYLLVQRKTKGLLANLWEFPSFDDLKDQHNAEDFAKLKVTSLLSSPFQIQYVGDVVHLFSHIHQTYVIFQVKVQAKRFKLDKTFAVKWVSEKDFFKSAVSTGMKKVFQKVKSINKTVTVRKGKGKES